jgi:hypothetical protein
MTPTGFDSSEQLEEFMSRPSPAAVDGLRRAPGDIVILGVGGKMGYTLARMARRASDESGSPRQIIGVSRFQNRDLPARLEKIGVEAITGDLLDRDFVAGLPDAPNVIFMAGMKFGSTGQEPLTWAMNTYLPAIVCERYRGATIAAFSTGNVYGLTPARQGGSVEIDLLNPVGEYAMSCLGRERTFEYFSARDGNPTTLIRLNYATELRYGVLVDIALQVYRKIPVDLSMGYVNVIWQGDACALTLAALPDGTSPARPLNVAGPEVLRVSDVATRFGELFDKPVEFIGAPGEDALLNNGSLAHRQYGIPAVSVAQMLPWIAAWISGGGELLGKPTHFESRSGRF